jgi:hypothetical protein
MEHVRYKPASDASAFFQAIAGFAVAALVMLGVGGTVYNLVAPGGWLAQAFGRSLAGGLAAILALLIVGVCMKMTHKLISVGSRNRYSEMFVYGFAATGAIYAFEYLIRGWL